MYVCACGNFRNLCRSCAIYERQKHEWFTMRKLNVKNAGAQGIVGSENPTPTGQTKSMTRPASSSVISYFPAKVKEIACAYHGHGRGADGGRCIMPEIGKKYRWQKLYGHAWRTGALGRRRNVKRKQKAKDTIIENYWLPRGLSRRWESMIYEVNAVHTQEKKNCCLRFSAHFSQFFQTINIKIKENLFTFISVNFFKFCVWSVWKLLISSTCREVIASRA